MVYRASPLTQKIGEVANVVGVKMGYSNIGIAPGHFSSLEHGIKVLCSSELGVAEVNEQALFATLKKQIPINAIGEVEILDVENCMQKPGTGSSSETISYVTSPSISSKPLLSAVELLKVSAFAVG